MRPFRKIVLSGAVFTIAVMLSACTGGGSDGRSVIGAGLDALSSLTSRGRAERSAALIDSGVAAVQTSEADSYMGQQEAALQAAVGSKGAKVTRAGDRIIITIPSSSAFGANSDDLGKGAQPVLSAAAGVMKKFNRTTVDVYGHTDSGGSEKKNLDLTQRRALAVAVYLAKQGIDEKRLSVTGFGASRPVSPNDNAEGRIANRRIEIQLSPVSAKS
jgi:outer membrane protein OmpA-like peptidoglycan-associated protein